MLCVETEEDKRELESEDNVGDMQQVLKQYMCSCMASARFPGQLAPLVAVAESGKGCGSDLPAFSGPQLTTTRS